MQVPSALTETNRTIQSDFADAMELMQTIAGLRAEDVLAFQETWSDADNQLIRSLDSTLPGFVQDGELTTNSFAARLPSVQDFTNVCKSGSLAIVGSGDSLRGMGLGNEIDAHTDVARFNFFVSKTQASVAEDVGE